MHKIFNGELYQVADTEMHRQARLCSVYQPCTSTYLGAALNALACKTQAKTSVDEDKVLTTFFTAEAAAYLRAMPNLYWLWKAVTFALVCSAEDDTHQAGQAIGLSSVKQAEQSMRAEVSYKFDLNKPVEQLTAAQLCSRAAHGLILVKAGPGDNDEIVVNPIFAPQ